jgi:hypothetical protein
MRSDHERQVLLGGRIATACLKSVRSRLGAERFAGFGAAAPFKISA